jgi:formylmethanofuran dehydrogenase subunit A
MDRTFRADALKTLPAKVRERTALAELDREYSLAEICIITRAGPARILGLEHKGHLGPGADADVTIYDPNENPQVMFELPRYVIQGGRMLVENGEIRRPENGRTLYVAPEYDRGVEADIADWFEHAYSVRFRNYPVDESYLSL